MTNRPVPERLNPQQAVLVLVDMQERFRSLIQGMDRVRATCERLVQFSNEMDIPVVVTEHYSRKLGVTLSELRSHFETFEPVEKIHFSCAGNDEFNKRLKTLGRSQVILCGIETHVCIYQTAMDLLRDGKQVAVVADAVSSCSSANRELGLQAMRDGGVQILGAQATMFELLRKAGTPEFKRVASLLKD